MEICDTANRISHEKASACVYRAAGCVFCDYVSVGRAFAQLRATNCCCQHELPGMEYSLLGDLCSHLFGASILLRA